MPTQAEYDAATEELSKAAQAEIAADVPVFLRGQVPTDKVNAFCHRAGKAVVDRLEALRAELEKPRIASGEAGEAD